MRHVRGGGFVVVLTIAVLISLPALATATPQQRGGRADETSRNPVVAGEDELAPVRAIREDLRRRLALPMETVDLGLIMEGADFAGTSPSAVRWDSDASRLWFQWRRWNEEETSTFEYSVESGELRQLSEEEAELAPTTRTVWDEGRRFGLWTSRNAVMLYDGDDKSTRKLFEGFNARPVRFVAGTDTVVISFDGNLYTVPLSPTEGEPLIRQLTDIRQGQAPGGTSGSESQRWVEAQQLALFDVLQRADERRQQQRERAERGRIKPLYTGSWRAGSMTPSPHLRWVAVSQSQPASGTERANVPNYVTQSGYTEDIATRTKVGDNLGSSRVGVIEASTGRVAWADFDLGDREVGAFGATWSPDGSHALVEVSAQDNKDRWLAVLTPRASDAGASDDDSLEMGVEIVFTEHDDAWINRGGGSGWLPDGETAYFLSESDGTMHLYTVPAGGGAATRLTSGDFEVFSPRVSHDEDAFIFEASIPNPFEVQTYRLPIAGGEPAALTGGTGRMNSTISPDGEWIAGVGSSSNAPWELFVKRTGEEGPGNRVTESPSPAFDSYPWIEPEIVHFPAEDGTSVPARLYVPENPHPDRPAVIFVHGAGYLHNVHRWWSSYSREFTFHHLLMEKGYTVLDIDYRGSAGYGRDWRTAIYRHMGGKDLSDQVDGARYLVEEHGIDPERIGLYGGSYGGFIALMAMFTAPDSFAAGAALRPVTDWAHYNHGYTSNILRSSPIYFAENLEGALLILHGLVDTNVHVQDTIRLAQRLIELRKDNWEVALYPVESHGFREPSSWYDEYRRILELFEENLKD